MGRAMLIIGANVTRAGIRNELNYIMIMSVWSELLPLSSVYFGFLSVLSDCLCGQSVRYSSIKAGLDIFRILVLILIWILILQYYSTIFSRCLFYIL